MSLRVTRQMVGVLGSQAGALRVSQQIIEILTDNTGTELTASASSALGLNQTLSFTAEWARATSSSLSLTHEAQDQPDVFEESVSSSLSLTHLAERGQELFVSAANSLSLVSLAERQLPRALSATNFLNLDHEALNNIIEVSAANTLVLTHQATNNIKKISASNSLVLSNNATYAGVIEQTVASVLNFVQSATQNLLFQGASSLLTLNQSLHYALNTDIFVEVQNTLNLTHEASTGNFIYERSMPELTPDDENGPSTLQLEQTVFVAGDRNLTVIQPLNLVQGLIVRSAVQNLSAQNFLSFSQSAGRVIELTASNSLELFQAAERKIEIIHELGLVQTLVGAAFKLATNTLSLTDAVARMVIFDRPASNTLNLLQSAAYVLNEPDECNYVPTVGIVSSGITPPSQTPPTLTRTTMNLQFPATSPTVTLTLNNPEFGNQDTLSFNRINRESRGGTHLVYADPTWPKTQTLRLQIENLKIETRNALISFLFGSVGQEILLNDWESRQWRGIITNPDAEITQTGVNRYAVTLTFEGVLV